MTKDKEIHEIADDITRTLLPLLAGYAEKHALRQDLKALKKLQGSLRRAITTHQPMPRMAVDDGE